jgi:pyridoxal 5'-phosphate synthase pdxS subunit
MAEVSKELERLRDLFYGLAELRDRLREAGVTWPRPLPVGTVRVKTGLPAMLRRGVIMDVTNVEQAETAEDAGAVGVMVLDKLPYDVRKAGGVARMADVKVIEEVMAHVTIPVSAKVRIGHFYEAVVLQQIGVDLIDESEVLTPVDEQHHINKWAFAVPFVNGCRECEALRRISEGASMIRSKGEAGRAPGASPRRGEVRAPHPRDLRRRRVDVQRRGRRGGRPHRPAAPRRLGGRGGPKRLRATEGVLRGGPPA